MRAFGLHTHIRSNIQKSVLLIVSFPFVLPLLFFVVALFSLGVFGNPQAFQIASGGAISLFVFVVIVTAVWLPIAYFMNRRIIDASTGSMAVTRQQEPLLWNSLENLCISCGMKMPALGIIETDALNAFASGIKEDDYAVTVTRGLLDNLDRNELEAVLAHELTHIRNRDVQLLVISTILVGVVPIAHDLILRVYWMFINGILAFYRGVFTVLPMPGAKAFMTLTYGLIFQAGRLVAWIIGSLSHLFSLLLSYSLSRKREFLADAGAIELTKNPDALISALQKVSGNSDVPSTIGAVREMYFHNAQFGGLEGMFATHPPIEKRIDAIIRYGRDVAKHQLEKIQAPFEAVHMAATAASGNAKESALSGVEHPLQLPSPVLEPRRRHEFFPAPPPLPPQNGRRLDVDYSPMLERALMSLRANNKTSRQAVYDRARVLQMQNLRQLQPALTDIEIVQEQLALEEAIGRLEEIAAGLEKRNRGGQAYK